MRAAVLGLVGAVLAGQVATAAPSYAEPINDWAAMRAAFVDCWTVPEGPDGSVMTLTFMLGPDGGLKGPPRVMARILRGSPEEQQAFEKSARGVLDRCLPMNLTPSFKRQMGESLVSLRLTSGPKVPAANLASYMSIFSSEKKGTR